MLNLLISMTIIGYSINNGFINLENPASKPLLPSGRTLYPSGIYDGEQPGYYNINPACKEPLIKLPVEILDKNGNLVTSGIYKVKLSADKSEISLIQGRYEYCLLVSKIINLTKQVSIPNVKITQQLDNKFLLIYRKDFVEVQVSIDKSE